ncbi:MAG: DNA gyrase/topoisomerase IV subunit A, partial [Flavobacteriaceae bacterium]
IWFDDIVGRLNVDGRGELLGDFRGDDLLLVIDQKGKIKTIPPDLLTRFNDDMVVLEKWNPKKPISIVHYEGEKDRYYIKRFLIENPSKEEIVISEHTKSHLELVSTDWKPIIEIEFTKPRGKEIKPKQQINVADFISVKGIKAIGNQLTSEKVKNINALEPMPFEEPKEPIAAEMEVVDEESIDIINKDIDSKDEGSDQTTLF